MCNNYFFILFLLICQGLLAQVGINTAQPNPNAALEVGVSVDRVGGFMPPTVTVAQRDAIPVTAADDGLMLYVTDPCGNRSLQLFDGVALAWEDVMSWPVPSKVWDFGNDTVTWPTSTGIGTTSIVVENLGLFPISTNTNFGAVNNDTQTFSDGFVATRRFLTNGPGYPGAFQVLPTQRYLYMGVSGSCRVKLWFRTGFNNNTRTMYITDGVNVLGSQSSTTDNVILEVNYTGGPTTLYIYGNNGCYLYKLEVCGAFVSTP